MDLRDLYQEVILDHNRRPRNFREMAHPTHTADGYNPLCGDNVHLYLTIRDGVVDDLTFQGSGCAISTASASLMTDALKGVSEADARALFDEFTNMVTSDQEPDLDALGKLAVFVGVREFPMRVKCATLVWHTLSAALKGEAEASTE